MYRYGGCDDEIPYWVDFSITICCALAWLCLFLGHHKSCIIFIIFAFIIFRLCPKTDKGFRTDHRKGSLFTLILIGIPIYIIADRYIIPYFNNWSSFRIPYVYANTKSFNKTSNFPEPSAPPITNTTSNSPKLPINNKSLPQNKLPNYLNKHLNAPLSTSSQINNKSLPTYNNALRQKEQ